jgi:hypothetical protein
VTEIDGYRIEVVSCALQGRELICKLTLTNLLGRGPGRPEGSRVLGTRPGGVASATLDNDAIIPQSPGTMQFDGRTGHALSNPGVKMNKGQPCELIVTFANVPEGVKRLKILDLGFGPELRLRNIEIERVTDK